MMPPHIFLLESVYALVIICCAVFIYLRTREWYVLSQYKGIAFFRNIFLFFMLAYVFRLVHLLLFTSPPSRFIPLSLLFVTFFSTLAVFFLAATIWKMHKYTPFLYGIALVLSLVVFVTRSHPLLLVLQAIILVVSLLPLFKKITVTKTTYLLLILFWLINLFFFIRLPLPLPIRIASYLCSIALFITIAVRVERIHAK